MTKQTSLRDIRTKAGITQDALADASGTSLRHIQRIERGDAQPTVKLAIAIARALGVTVEDVDWLENE